MLLKLPSTTGHILSEIYNCTKPGNQPIDNCIVWYFRWLVVKIL